VTEGRRATQYLLRSLNDGEGNKETSKAYITIAFDYDTTTTKN